MANVFASSVLDLGFERRKGNSKDYNICICFFSAKHRTLRSKNKIGWLRIRIICPSGATCLPVDCSVSQLTLYVLVIM